MPYNPGSAYPRKTIYVPPTYGDHSFQRATNAPDVTSRNTAGGGPFKARGRGVFAGQAAGAQGASGHPDAATGFTGMQRQGIVGKESSKFMEQRGLKQNKGSLGEPNVPSDSAVVDLPRGTFNMDDAGTVDPAQTAGIRQSSTHANPAVAAKQAAASGVADSLADGVLTGEMPGNTGVANTKKARRAANLANQQTLFP